MSKDSPSKVRRAVALYKSILVINTKHEFESLIEMRFALCHFKRFQNRISRRYYDLICIRMENGNLQGNINEYKYQ